MYYDLQEQKNKTGEYKTIKTTIYDYKKGFLKKVEKHPENNYRVIKNNEICISTEKEIK